METVEPGRDQRAVLTPSDGRIVYELRVP